MKVNGKEITAKYFAYDGCHKIYILENDQNILEAKEYNYSILNIDKLHECYLNSCELRFISNWDLTIDYAEQFKEAIFEE